MSNQLASRILRFTVVISLALSVQVWAALQWTANFDGDEAVFGLMARHVLHGEVSTYMWGQSYLGSLEAWLAAICIQLWGSSVVALRLPSLILFGVFLILHASVVYQAWGERVALFSLLILGLPPFLILWWTFKPVGYDTMLVCGTAALLVARLNITRPSRQFMRVTALGIIAGIGLWSHPLTLIYFAAIGVCAWLSLPEWASVYERCAGGLRRMVRVPTPVFGLSLSAILAALLFAAFFTGACTPQAWFGAAQGIARLGLLVSGASIWLAMFAASSRRRQWLVALLGFGAGFILGNLPQWRAWLVFGYPPDSALVASCPTSAPIYLVATSVLPAMFGLPLLDGQPFTIWSYVTWLVIVPLILTALALFMRSERGSLRALINASPLAARDTRGILFGLLVAMPILFTTLSSNTVAALNVRYLMPAWQAFAVMLAALFAARFKHSRVVLLGLCALWLTLVGLSNLSLAGRFWSERADTFSPVAVSALDGYLTQAKVHSAYAEYFLAYSLDFLFAERVTIAPYNGINRYHAYTDQVDALPVQAYLMWANTVPSESSQIGDLLLALKRTQGAGAARTQVIERLARQRVLERRHIANWDVWLVSDP